MKECLVKFIFLLLPASIPALSFSQHSIPDDTLSKYSYLILQTKTNTEDSNGTKPLSIAGYASGFFMKYNNNLFFITAYHIATGVDIYNNKLVNFFFDSLRVRYFTKENKCQSFYLARDFQLPSEFALFPGKADIYIYKIDSTLLDAPGIHYILCNPESSLLKTKSDSISTSVLIYGYNTIPRALLTDNREEQLQTIASIKPDLYKGKIYEDTTGEITPDGKHLYILSEPGTAVGGSGSPVFFKHALYRKNKLIREWVEFGGIQCATSRFGHGVILKRNEVLQEITNY